MKRKGLKPSIPSEFGGIRPVKDLVSERGMFLAREDVRKIVALGPVVSPPLLELLEPGGVPAGDLPDPCIIVASATLLGALREPAALKPLSRLLLACDDMDWDNTPILYECMLGGSLARLGPPGWQFLFDTASAKSGRVSDYVRDVAAEGLAAADIPEVDDLILQLFQRMDGDVTYLARALCRRGHPQAVTLVAEAQRDGRLGDRSMGYTSAEAFFRDARQAYDHRNPGPDPFLRFLPAFRAEFQRVEFLLLCAEEWADEAFEKGFKAELLVLQAALLGYQANVPCFCGSGGPGRDCCGPFLEQLATVTWPARGYRWLPSRQLSDLPRADVREHVALLSASLEDLRSRSSGLRNDYLRWAAALRFEQLNCHRESNSLQRSVVESTNPRHPALALNDLERGHLAHVWRSACRLEQTREDRTQIFLAALQAEPDYLWSAVAMAETIGVAGTDVVVPVLQQAIGRAADGHSRGLPGLLEIPCPPWILERYLAALQLDEPLPFERINIYDL